jgi:hypothetical protein
MLDPVDFRRLACALKAAMAAVNAAEQDVSKSPEAYLLSCTDLDEARDDLAALIIGAIAAA